MTDDKIKFYEQVLELEPASRLFFPLASLYYEQNELHKARQALSRGLEIHPQHFEARLLLANILNQQGEQEQAREIYREFFELLKDNNDFWESLTRIFSSQGQKDLSLAASFFARSGSGKAITWTDVLQAGLDNIGAGYPVQQSRPSQVAHRVPGEPEETEDRGFPGDADLAGRMEEPQVEGWIAEDGKGILDAFSKIKVPESGTLSPGPAQKQETDEPLPEKAPEPGEDAFREESDMPPERPSGTSQHLDEFEDPEELEDFDIEVDARTRSMADILFGQEEYAKALDIYQDLWRQSLPGGERNELEDMINRAKQAMSIDEAEKTFPPVEASGDEMSAGDEAINFLMSLADRLEARSA